MALPFSQRSGSSERDAGAAATLPQLLRLRARRDPGRRIYTFLLEGETEAGHLTYGELDRRAGVVAAALLRTCAPGDRALLLFPPGLEFIAAFFGCLYAGVVAVPAYPPRPRRDRQRLETIVRDCGPHAVLTTGALLAATAPLAAEVPGFASLPWIATDELEASGGESAGWPQAAPAWPAFLQYTSGSTAAPKGVIVSHANLMHNERMIQAAFRQDADSVVVGWLPLYHDMGLIGNVLQPLFCGARCILMSPMAFLQRPRRWLEAIGRFRATTSGGPNFAYDLCVQKVAPREREGLDLSSWRVAFNGAEPVRAETLARFAEAFAPCGFQREAFYPCYGLAEGTLFAAGPRRAAAPEVRVFDAAALEQHRVEPGADGPRALVACGGSWEGQRIAIADPATGRELPAGRVGEIWLSGPSVAAGYWGREEETARTFGAFLAADGGAAGPFLRTGDLGFVAAGELFVTGRLKDLVIVRGRNHYPQDLELAAERGHPELRPGSMAAFSVEGGDGELLVVVGEVERRFRAGVEQVAAAVRRAVSEEHEVQVHEVVLIRTGTLPKTSSGKIQRHLCRARYLAGELEVVGASALERPAGRASAEPAALPARDALLALPAVARHAAILAPLAGLVARGLGLSAAGVESAPSLTGAGLDSLASIELAAAVEAAWGIALSPADLLAGCSLAGLADRVLEELAKPCAEARPARIAAEEPECPPPGQQGLWYLQRLTPDSAAYNIAGAARLAGPVDAAALRRAFQRLLDRHAALRTTFAATSEGLVQRVHEGAEIAFVEENAAGWSAEQLRGRLHEEAFRPFDLERGPLLRVALFRGRSGEEEASWLVLTVHHIAADFWSLAVVARELAAFYAEASTRAWFEPAAPGPRYSEHARWQAERLAGSEGERLWRYWLEQLAGAPRLELPVDRPRPPVEVHAGAARLRRWGPEMIAAVRGLARRCEATPFMVLLAAFQALLARYSGQTDFLVGSPTSGRAGSAGRFASLVGYCVNPVALRADLAGAPNVVEWLGRVRRTALAAFAHQDLPFALLAERLQPARETGLPPLFQTMLALEQAPQSDLEALAAFSLQLGGVRLALGGLELESVALDIPAAQYDLTLLACELAGELTAALCFKTDLFETATVERMLGHFGNLLSAMAGEPERRLWDLDLLAAEERRQLLTEWNRTRADYPREATIHRLFEQWAEEAPDRIALVDPQRGLALSYGALHRRADHLARELRAYGAGPETLVGVALERSAAMVEATLAVLKAGAAYVPLDPASPRRHLESLVREVSLPLLLTESRWLPGLPATPRCLCLDRLEARPADGSAVVAADPQGLAYAMFTSGSTGAPKAVGVAHGSVVRLVRGTDYIDFGREQVFLQLAPAAFDAATLEIWGPLANGGRLVLFPPRPPSFSELGEIIAEQGVTTLWLTAGLFHQVVEHRLEALRPVAQLLAGGDVLSARHVNRLLAELPGCRLFNGYGPTESTTFTCVHAVREPVPSGASVPIGRPIANTRVYVLDESLAPVPVGVAGELCIGGDGLARGYLLRPALTAERFVPSPFRPQPEPGGEPAEPPGARLYRTGDRVRLLAGGIVEFLGRMDRQTKIRGFRVEPAEVEAALVAHPDVREAAVLVDADPTEGEIAARRLVAFVVAGHSAVVPAAELRGFLQQRLPEPMVPAAFVHLETLPLTANGKVDRRALAAMASAHRQEGAALYAEPRTPTEELLAGIWADLLRVERIGIHDDFFALGGHSLLASRLLARVERALGVELPLGALFQAPTVAALAARLAALGGAEPLPPLGAALRTEPLPLSFAQQRLWFLDQMEPESAAYNVPGALRLRGPLRAGALAVAVREAVRRHESLRTGFAAERGEPRQVIAPEVRTMMTRIDLSALPEPARSAEAAGVLRCEAARRFDLSRPPLLRVCLLRLAGEEHAFLLTIHHIVSDGLSLQVLSRELAALYSAAVEGQPSPLPPPPQYADFALWQRRVLTGGRLERLLGYWRERLAGLPALELPTDRPRPAVSSPRGGSRRIEIPAALAARLRAVSRSLGVTPFMTLLGGFAALFARYSGQEDFALGSPVATRGRVETEGMVGLLVNTLVLRAELTGDPAAGGLLQRLREAVLGAHAHQDLPFERLVEELQPERALGRTPLFQVMVGFFSAADEETAEFSGLRAEPLEVDNGTAKFDLTALLREERQRLSLALVYRRDLFEAATVDRLGAHYVRLLEGIAGEPGTRISELPLLSLAEVHQLAGEWSPPPVEVPRDRTVHELFEQQARRTPDRPAVVCRDERLTYAELDRRAGFLAGALRRLGVGPEVLVGLCVERSVAAIVGILGVLKAGGAYLPLDPEYPRQRLAFMLEDSRAKVLLTQERLLPRLPAAAARVVLLERLPEADAAREEACGLPAAAAANAAYVIYTSGSTGRPKGTLIEHRSVVNLAYALRSATYGARPAPLRVSVNASLAFDASVKQIVQLLHGHTLHILPEEVRRDGERLLACLREQPLDVLDCTPSQLGLLLASGLLEESDGISPAMALVGGEVIGDALWRRLAADRRTSFYNVYGPTECTVDATACTIGAGAARPTLGRPLANVRIRLLDGRLQAVPAGVPGELCIAGAGLARGYLSQPELTAQRFVPDAASPDPGARLYRTGDLARHLPDGRLEYLGRADRQVKVRGLRIELGEIEARLELVPGIDRAVVDLREDSPGDPRLVAYFTGGESLTDTELRLALRRDLPDAMVPAAFMRLAALPLSAHGKVDRVRLPSFSTALERQFTAPRSPLEESLARLWGELLRLDRIGIRDNFFELGGHSLLALQLAGRLRQAMGVETSVRVLFEHPTIEELAPILERAAAPQSGAPEPVLGPARRRGGRDLGQLMAEVGRLSPEETRRRLAERDGLEGRF